ncbi:MAG: hypothetical protein RL385_1230 [Pseudomonadota bacterium]|jgi:response regulator RpfG family c-di-GMP phosphodiesterase
MPRLRILYVDDTPLLLDAFRQALADGPYEVVTAGSILEAQRAARHGSFDIAIIDYHLGEERGDACMALLRRAQPETRYFLYTSDSEMFRKHREMGFDGVLMLKGKGSARAQIDIIAKSLSRTRTP